MAWMATYMDGILKVSYDLGRILPVGLRFGGDLSQQHRVLLGDHTQIVVEGVVPDFFFIMSQWVTMSCSM